MKIRKKKKINKKLLIGLIVFLILALVFAVSIASRLNTGQSTKDTVNDTKAQPNATLEEKQQDSKDTDNLQQPTESNNISVVLSAATQDTSGGPIIIRSILEPATGGTCAFTAKKSGTTKFYSSNAIFSGTYYSCNYDIPYSDVSNGVWSVTVSVKDGSGSGSSTQEVNVK